MKHIFFRRSFPIFLLGLLGIACQKTSPVPPVEVRIVETEQGFRFIRGDSLFWVRGVSGQTRLRELKSVGGNTLRTYDTVGLRQVLDSAQHYGLAVIAGLYVPKSNEAWFYDSDSLVELYAQQYEDIARRYRHHPALLAWCLGNELNFKNFFDFGSLASYRQLLQALRRGDPGHPIGLATANYGEREMLNLTLKMRDLDFTLINTFGRLHELEEDLANLQWLWRKPFIIGEYGEPGPWEARATKWAAPLELYSHQKAAVLESAYRQKLPRQSPYFMGSLAFYWGWRHEQTPTWFNIFSRQGEKTNAYYRLAQVWGYTLPKSNRPPQIDSLLVEGLGEADLLVFDAGQSLIAQVMAHDPDGDSLEYRWSLRPEDWFFIIEKPPSPVANTFAGSDRAALVRWQCPRQPGPYRLYVEVRDGHQHFAAANIPIYVVLP